MSCSRGGAESRLLRVAASDQARDVLAVDARARGENQQALDRVAQLAHVPRPIELRQSFDSIRRDAARRHTFALREHVDEMTYEKWNVLAPLAKRRDVNRDDVQAIEQVFAETILGNLALEILVRRGEDADVHLDRLRAADARDDAVLQDAEHLGLRGEAHVAHFVEEERAAMRLLELPRPIGDGAGERALHVTEQLTLDQLARNRRAVYFDERLVERAWIGRGWRGRRAPCPCRSRR